MISNNQLRVKVLLEAYFEGFIEYAIMLQDEYNLTNEQVIGVVHMSVNPKLSKLSVSWKKVEPITASFSNIEDGDYIGDIKEIKLGEAKKGRIQVVFDWEIADGEFAGKVQKQFYGISDDKGNPDEKGMGYFKNVCEVIGLDLPEDLNLWQEVMDEYVSNNTGLFEITAKANGQYTNIFVNGLSEYTKGEEETVEQEEEEETTAEEVEEEAVEEEEVEVEEEEQEVIPLPKKVVAKATAKPVAKAVTKPAAKPAAKPIAKTVTHPTKKIVSLSRR